MALEIWESTSEQHLLVANLTSIVTDIERRLAARDDADRVFEIEDVGMELEDDAYYDAIEIANPLGISPSGSRMPPREAGRDRVAGSTAEGRWHHENPFLDELATPVWTADAVEVVCAACRSTVIARRCR